MRVIVTGGHVTPALAVIDELLPENEVHFVGRKYVNPSEKVQSFEYKEIREKRLPFYHLDTGRLTRLLSVAIFSQIKLFAKGIVTSNKIISKVKPDVIVSFGGYLALPVAFVAWTRGIPVVTHEQTISPGLSNKIIALFASKVCISFPETEKSFKKNVVVTGNPIRKSVGLVDKKVVSGLLSKPLLYITGGALGAHMVNIHIENILQKLLQTFVVVHQTGNVQEFADFDRLSKIKDKNYYLREHILSSELGWLFENADIIVSRSGANTIFELMATKTPAVLIPLPWSAKGEQRKHASFLMNKGVAEVFEQDGDSNDLLKTILNIHKNKDTMKQKFSQLESYVHADAAEKIVKVAYSALKD